MNTDRLKFATAMLFACGLLPGIYEFFHPSFGFGRANEMAVIARNLAANGVFGNPFEPYVTGPTAVNPPLYPLFLAALIKIFGPLAWVLVADVLNIILNAAIAALLPRVSAIVYGDPLPGIFAGALWISAMRLLPQWDATCTVAGVLVFCILSARAVELSRSVAPAGIVGGALTLLNPATVLVSLPWLVYVLRRGHVSMRTAVRYVTIAVAIMAACNAPWLVRNYRIWGAPVLRTNFGFTIYASNNDCAQPSSYSESSNGCYQQTHPTMSATEARMVQAMGEYTYDRARTAGTLRWIRANPRRFGELTAARFVEFWFPEPHTAPRAAYAIWVITLLSLPGILLMVRRHEAARYYIWAVWVLYPLMYYIVVSGDRYRFPILWTSLLPAGYFAAALVRRFRVEQSSKAAPA